MIALASVVWGQEKVALAPKAATGPQLSARNVVNAADYRPGGVAPSEVVVLYAANAGPPEMVAWALDPLHMKRYSLVSLGDTRVLFDNVPAPIVYARSGQICAIVPYQVAGRKTTEIVVEYQGERSPPVTLPVVASAPALFTLDASGAGQAAMLNDTGCCNSVRNPAVRGRAAVLYATGEGLPLPDSANRPASPLPMKVTVGGVPAEILWSGNVGVLQVNFRVPANAPVGDAVALVLTVGSAKSSPAVTLAVRSARQEILVVDADAAIRQRLAAILSGAGYHVSTASDGREAMEVSKLHVVDLVVTDQALPSEANLEMLRAIRQDHQLVKTAAIVEALSPEALKTADLLGSQAVLAKPLAASIVLQRVRTLLQRRNAVY